jgi:hypothetical protein
LKLLGEDLIRVPIALQHRVEDAVDKLVRDILVEQGGHRVDKDPAGFLPAQREVEALRRFTTVRNPLCAKCF